MPEVIERTPGLTTGRAPFIEQARSIGSVYIRQPYEQYSEENHRAWRSLYARMLPLWRQYANERFLDGIISLCLDPRQVPLNRRLALGRVPALARLVEVDHAHLRHLN